LSITGGGGGNGCLMAMLNLVSKHSYELKIASYWITHLGSSLSDAPRKIPSLRFTIDLLETTVQQPVAAIYTVGLSVAALLAQKLGLSDLVDEHRRSGW
jgi:hypothetical protein